MLLTEFLPRLGYGLITSAHVEDAMRSVDRAYFVPKSLVSEAYLDQPVKFRNVHLSAPHMYVSILENLDLPPDQSEGLSFLNIGSGTGYLSCLVAWILGQRSSDLQYGVEIFDDVIEHCRGAMYQWKSLDEKRSFVNVKLVHGDGLCISSSHGQGRFGFDRIYVGATISLQDLSNIMKLLTPGGILVCPCVECLIKITRSAKGINDGYNRKVISCVRFASIIRGPNNSEVILPAALWTPKSHPGYSKGFRNCIETIIPCSVSNLNTMYQYQPDFRYYHFSFLSVDVWQVVFSFMNREWFNIAEVNEEYAEEGNDVLTIKKSNDDSVSDLLFANIDQQLHQNIGIYVMYDLLYPSLRVHDNFGYELESYQSDGDEMEEDTLADFRQFEDNVIENNFTRSLEAPDDPMDTDSSRRTVSLGDED